MVQAEQCPECQACYVRSRASFECIPVVEVFLEEGIADAEVSAPVPHRIVLTIQCDIVQ